MYPPDFPPQAPNKPFFRQFIDLNVNVNDEDERVRDCDEVL
jgi:hypothetical protein